MFVYISGPKKLTANVGGVGGREKLGREAYLFTSYTFAFFQFLLPFQLKI